MPITHSVSPLGVEITMPRARPTAGVQEPPQHQQPSIPTKIFPILDHQREASPGQALVSARKRRIRRKRKSLSESSLEMSLRRCCEKKGWLRMVESQRGCFGVSLVD